MKKPIDKPRKRKDTPAVSKKEFIAAYCASAQEELYPEDDFSEKNAADFINDVAEGRDSANVLLTELARAYGAKRGRVGNFLRSLK